MMDKIVIKEAPIEDIVKVNATITEFGKPYKKDHFEKRCDKKDKLILAAYINNKPVGYLVGYDRYNDKSFYCWMAGVDPRHRKKGILKLLMDYEEKWARKKSYNKIKIKTRNNKRAMIAYLVKYGFLFTEVVKADNIQENRLFLEKEI